MSWWAYLSALCTVYAVHRVLQFRQNARKVSNLPGLRSIFSPASPLGALIPTCFWNPGLKWQWDWRNQVYANSLQTMSALGFVNGGPVIFARSLDVAKEFLSRESKGKFGKARELTAVLSFYGKNLFTVDGSEWSRHRRVMNPAFSPETYALVWDEATNVYQEMIKAEG
ncbi:hypothetical protein K438DRAFT_1979888 [Mycena galopus ATCC 62051]|nr:hypothetical protein K438DRAFT_1979888 [Mycena galopus ATCC 62051]